MGVVENHFLWSWSHRYLRMAFLCRSAAMSALSRPGTMDWIRDGLTLSSAVWGARDGGSSGSLLIWIRACFCRWRRSSPASIFVATHGGRRHRARSDDPAVTPLPELSTDRRDAVLAPACPGAGCGASGASDLVVMVRSLEQLKALQTLDEPCRCALVADLEQPRNCVRRWPSAGAAGPMVFG